MADDGDWDKEMERLDERTAKRRAKAKEQEEEAQSYSGRRKNGGSGTSHRRSS
jgi:F0F1-type ATP synthase assembly protein I